MKIRIGFVSNSSSSSYLIAVKKDISLEQKNKIVENYILPLYEKLIKEEKEVTVSKEDLIEFFFQRGDVSLDNWELSFGVSSNDNDFISYFLYSFLNIDTDVFKFKSLY
jgi:hypothetical protein